jgi:hypothetical protein
VALQPSYPDDAAEITPVGEPSYPVDAVEPELPSDAAPIPSVGMGDLRASQPSEPPAPAPPAPPAPSDAGTAIPGSTTSPGYKPNFPVNKVFQGFQNQLEKDKAKENARIDAEFTRLTKLKDAGMSDLTKAFPDMQGRPIEAYQYEIQRQLDQQASKRKAAELRQLSAMDQVRVETAIMDGKGRELPLGQRVIESPVNRARAVSMGTARFVKDPEGKVYLGGREIPLALIAQREPALAAYLQGGAVMEADQPRTQYQKALGMNEPPVAYGSRTWAKQGLWDTGKRVLNPKTGKLEILKGPLGLPTIEDVLTKVAGGAAEGATQNIVNTAQFGLYALGKDKAADMLQKLVVESKVPNEYKSFVDTLANGAGSIAGSYALGIGTARLANMGKAGQWLAAAVAGSQEAAAEGTGSYQSMIEQGKSPEDARKAMWQTFAANIPLNIVLDKIGILNSEAGTYLQKIAKAHTAEFVQEGAQQIIQNLATGRPWHEGVTESAVVGGILGAATKGGEIASRNVKASRIKTERRDRIQVPSMPIVPPSPAGGAPVSPLAPAGQDSGAPQPTAGAGGGPAGSIQGAFQQMGQAVTGNLYSGLFDSLRRGKSTMAGVKDPVIAKAKPYFDAGLIKSPDDLKALVQNNFPPMATTSPTGDDMAQVLATEVQTLQQLQAQGQDVAEELEAATEMLRQESPGHPLTQEPAQVGYEAATNEPKNIGERLAQAFSPGGFEKWRQDMLADPESQGGRHLDPDRGILIAGGTENPADVFKTASAENASNIASHILEAVRGLNMNPEPGRDGRYVVIGSPASGKTFTAAELAKKSDTRFAVSPGFIASQDPIGRSIALANAGDYSGSKPTIAFTFNPDIPLLMKRYTTRTESEQRSVAMDKMVSDWLEGPSKVLDGLEKYRGEFDFQMVDTSTGKTYTGDAAVNNLSALVDDLKGYSHDQVKDEFQRAIKVGPPEASKPNPVSSPEPSPLSGREGGERGIRTQEQTHGGSPAGEVAKPSSKDRLVSKMKEKAKRLKAKTVKPDLAKGPSWEDVRATQKVSKSTLELAKATKPEEPSSESLKEWRGRQERTTPDTGRTYDELQSAIDKAEDAIEREGANAAHLYDPALYRKDDLPEGYTPMPESLAQLYRERDAIGAKGLQENAKALSGAIKSLGVTDPKTIKSILGRYHIGEGDGSQYMAAKYSATSASRAEADQRLLEVYFDLAGEKGISTQAIDEPADIFRHGDKATVETAARVVKAMHEAFHGKEPQGHPLFPTLRDKQESVSPRQEREDLVRAKVPEKEARAEIYKVLGKNPTAEDIAAAREEVVGAGGKFKVGEVVTYPKGGKQIAGTVHKEVSPGVYEVRSEGGGPLVKVVENRMSSTLSTPGATVDFLGGQQNIPVVSAEVTSTDPFYSDPDSGAKTIYQKVDTEQAIKYKDINDVMVNSPRFKGFYRDPKVKIPFAVEETRVEMQPDGTRLTHYRMTAPDRSIYHHSIPFDRMEELTPSEAKDAWKAYKEEKGPTEKKTVHMISGAMLNIWNRFPEKLPMTVGRVKLSNGTTVMGRVIPEGSLHEVLRRIGAESALGEAEKHLRAMQGGDAIKSVLMDGRTISLANGYRIVPVKRSGEFFAVLEGPPTNYAINQMVNQYPGWKSEQFQGQFGTNYKLVIPNTPEARDSLSIYLKAAPVSAMTEPRAGWIRPRSGNQSGFGKLGMLTAVSVAGLSTVLGASLTGASLAAAATGIGIPLGLATAYLIHRYSTKPSYLRFVERARKEMGSSKFKEESPRMKEYWRDAAALASEEDFAVAGEALRDELGGAYGNLVRDPSDIGRKDPTDLTMVQDKIWKPWRIGTVHAELRPVTDLAVKISSRAEEIKHDFMDFLDTLKALPVDRREAVTRAWNVGTREEWDSQDLVENPETGDVEEHNVHHVGRRYTDSELKTLFGLNSREIATYWKGLAAGERLAALQIDEHRRRMDKLIAKMFRMLSNYQDITGLNPDQVASKIKDLKNKHAKALKQGDTIIADDIHLQIWALQESAAAGLSLRAWVYKQVKAMKLAHIRLVDTLTHNEAYAPLHRQGDQEAVLIDPATKDAIYIMAPTRWRDTITRAMEGKFERPSEASINLAIKKASEEYGIELRESNVLKGGKYHMDPKLRALTSPLDPTRLANLIDSVTADPSLVGMLSEEETRSLAEMLRAGAETARVKDFMAENRLRHHLLERKGTYGETLDGLSAWAGYVQAASQSIAANENMDDLQQAVERISPVEKPRLREYAEHMKGQMIAPDQTNPMIENAIAITALWTIGGKLSFAVQNASQFMVEYQRLVNQYGHSKALGASLRGQIMAARIQTMMGLQRLGVALGNAELSSIDPFAQIRDPKIQKITRDAFTTGIFMDRAGDKLIRYAQGRAGGRISDAAKVAKTLLMAPATLSEQNNRVRAFLGYALAQSQANPDLNTGKLMADAENHVRHAHFERASYNKSKLERSMGGMGSMLTMFQYFMHEFVQETGNAFRVAYMGEKEAYKYGTTRTAAQMARGLVTPGTKAWKATKGLRSMSLMMYALAGLTGFKLLFGLYDLAKDLLSKLSQSIFGTPYDPTKDTEVFADIGQKVYEMGIKNGFSPQGARKLHDVVINGIPNAFGVDMSGSISPGIYLLPDTTANPKVRGADYLVSMAGVPGNIFARLADAWISWGNGEKDKALRAALPAFLKHWQDAYTGKVQMGGRSMDLSPTERAIKATGFTPTRLAREFWVKDETQQKMAVLNGLKSKLGMDLLRAKRKELSAEPADKSAAKAKVAEALAAIGTHNKHMGDLAKQGQSEANQYRVIPVEFIQKAVKEHRLQNNPVLGVPIRMRQDLRSTRERIVGKPGEE